MKMVRKQANQKKIFLYGIMILLLLVFQKVLGKVGRRIADLLPYERFDPYKAFAGVTLVYHILMLFYNMLPVYDFPLNKNNIFGTLGFQLLLSGPAEEILYRALPITMLVHVSGKSVKVKWGITLETIIASFLFAIAHMKWSLLPFTIEANYFQLFYAFVLGTIQGKAYQDSRSIVYPMLMHSISNVVMVGTGYLFLLL